MWDEVGGVELVGSLGDRGLETGARVVVGPPDVLVVTSLVARGAPVVHSG